MPEVQKILDLVAEGKLTAQEADEILTAMAARDTDIPAGPPPAAAKTTHIRILVSDGGRDVVNLRVPLNVAGWASNFLPGLSDQDADRIRGAIASGSRGTILDISDRDGSRVVITSE